MGEVIPFTRPAAEDLEQVELDLLGAADFVIRDLREIALRSGCTWSRERAEQCRLILDQAFNAALAEGYLDPS